MKKEKLIKILKNELSEIEKEEILIKQRQCLITRRKREIKVSLEELGTPAKQPKQGLSASTRKILLTRLTPLSNGNEFNM